MLGVLLLWSVAWSAPVAIADGGTVATPAGGDTARLGVSFSPIPFVELGGLMAWRSPALSAALRFLRLPVRRPNDRGVALQRLTRALWFAPSVVIAVFFLALAVLAGGPGDTWDTADAALTVAEIAAFIVGLLACVLGVVGGLRQKDRWSTFAALIWALAATAVVLLARETGLLDKWADVLTLS